MRHRTTAATQFASLIFLLLLGFSATAEAEQVVVTPQDTYAEIDTQLATETMRALQKGSRKEKAQTIDAIKASPDKYAPPVFYLLSNVLFERGEKDEGAFWFYAGQLRARFDANRCADSSARQAVSALNQEYGPPINQYAFKDIPKLEALIQRVVEWDRQTPHNYDHRWINLHGMGAMLSGLGASSSDAKLSLPADQWELIAEKTRVDYLDGFQQAMAQMKGMKK